MQAPSVFTGPLQTPWYKPRGLFLSPPTLQLRKGRWTVTQPEGGSARRRARGADATRANAEARTKPQTGGPRGRRRSISRRATGRRSRRRIARRSTRFGRGATRRGRGRRAPRRGARDGVRAPRRRRDGPHRSAVPARARARVQRRAVCPWCSTRCSRESGGCWARRARGNSSERRRTCRATPNSHRRARAARRHRRHRGSLRRVQWTDQTTRAPARTLVHRLPGWDARWPRRRCNVPRPGVEPEPRLFGRRPDVGIVGVPRRRSGTTVDRPSRTGCARRFVSATCGTRRPRAISPCSRTSRA